MRKNWVTHTERRPIYQVEWRGWIYQRCYCNSVGTSLEQNEVWQFHSFSCHLFESQALKNLFRASESDQPWQFIDATIFLTCGNPKETWKLLKFGVFKDVPVSVPSTPDIPKTAVNRVWKRGRWALRTFLQNIHRWKRGFWGMMSLILFGGWDDFWLVVPRFYQTFE